MKFPTTITDDVLIMLADRAVEILPWDTWSAPCVFGIARSGLPIAQAVFNGLSRVMHGVSIATLNPYSDVQPIFATPDVRTAIIADNAVTTGKTIKWAHQTLYNAGVQPTAVIRFFDREEVSPAGDAIIETLKDDMNLKLFSLFRIRDLLPDLHLPDSERQAILNQLVRFGTHAIQTYLEETYVFQNNAWAIRREDSAKS
ncbi:MAG: hypothetical protein V1860_01875 [bacterium]